MTETNTTSVATDATPPEGITTVAAVPNQNETTTGADAAAPAATTETVAAQSTPAFDFEMPDLPSDEGTTTATTQQAAPVTSWKDAIKEVDRLELLKEAGLDDFTIQLAQHLKNGGNAEDYLTAKAVDWNKVSDDKLLKEQLKADFPEASKEQIDLFFNRKYSQQELADDDDKAVGEMLMKSEARKLRQQRIEHQQKFQIAQPQSQAQAQQPELTISPEVESYFKATFTSKVFQEAKNSKRVDIPLPDGSTLKFGLKQPDLLVRASIDNEFQRKLNMTQSGEPDALLVAQKALFNLYPKEYTQQIFERGKEAYKAQMIAEGQNAGFPKQTAGGSDAIPMKQAWSQARVTTGWE